MYYTVELKRKNTGDKKKNGNKNEAHNNFKDKDKEKANVAASVIIEEPLDATDILCATWQQIMLKLMICRLQRTI